MAGPGRARTLHVLRTAGAAPRWALDLISIPICGPARADATRQLLSHYQALEGHTNVTAAGVGSIAREVSLYSRSCAIRSTVAPPIEGTDT